MGVDISGAYDLDPAMRAVSGQRALAERIIRRLTTTLGALQDHPDYGFNIDNLIGTSATDAVIEQGVLGQCFLEEEIDDAALTITRVESSLALQLKLFNAEGPFEFTLSVSDLGVSAIIPPALS